MPTKRTLFMETTEVPAEKTAGEVISELVKAGANQINTEYDNGAIVGLRWIMRIAGQDALFAMPARIEPIYNILLKRAKNGSQWYGRPEQIENLHQKARRVAWRQLLRWTQAQLAMIECGMAEAGEVFFPYLQTPAGTSIFDTYKEHGMKMLPPAPPS